MSTAEFTATWMRRRASNVYGRPVFLARTSGIAFVIALLSFLLLARESSSGAGRGAAHAMHAHVATPDSAERQTAEQFARNARALTTARALRRSSLQGDASSPAARARRDSLATLVAEITRLLVRTDDAPLVASFRALGTSTSLRGAPHLVQLLDSLNDLEKARSDFGSSQGADPIFVALTARVGAIGHEIETVARNRRAELRREIDSLTPPPILMIDTVSLDAPQESAERAHATAVQGVTSARAADSVARARDADESQEPFGVGVPTLVLAAAVVAIVLALAIALTVELRWPRIANVAEAEALCGARVLATIGEQVEVPDRQRRSADREVPPSIEPSSEGYRLLYGQLADATFALTVIAVAGEHPFVTASVAANLAAIAARSGRPTLLLDTDFRAQPVAAMMGVPAMPGVADVLTHRLGWAGAISSVLVSRGRSIDVLPSGALAGTMQAVADEFASEVDRLSRRYETVVLSASTPEQGTIAVAAGAVGEVVLCVRRGRSTHESLRSLLAAVEISGARMKGVVLWDREDPVPPIGSFGAGRKLELLG